LTYSRSVYRKDFEIRLSLLKSEARKASKLPKNHQDIRDMVYQCAIFQTSAAIESYLKLIIESWFQEIKIRSLGASIPDNVRGHLAVKKFGGAFEKYMATRDEANIVGTLGSEKKFWSVMMGAADIPHYIKGADLHDGTAYPSYKNIQKLFSRLGVSNIHGQIAAILKRDVETMIESFQSIRTALAHAAPPNITLDDVRNRLSDMADLVRALDRIFYRLINAHGGTTCWK
jgi:hypothetical protein